MELNPSFVDLQVNGHGGVDFLSVTNISDVRLAARSLFSNGVSAFLPTLITSEQSRLHNVAKLINEVMSNPLEGEAEILGLHLEGPFISMEKCGVHPIQHILPPEIATMKSLLKLGLVKMVTLAPEVPGAINLIKFLVAEGVVVSLGHSNANEGEAHKGFDAGAITVTHLFNAMSKIPGLASVALERSDVWIQIIVDDVHVNRDNIKFALSKALDRFIITNDCVAAAGLGEGRFNFGDMTIQVKDGQARRLDGTLAGGIGNLHRSLKILDELGIDRRDSYEAVTSRPLKLINGAFNGNV